MMFRTCTKWLAIVLAATAGLLLTTVVWRIGYGSPLLSWPIRLVSDFRLEQEFNVWRKASYRISVQCSPLAEQEHLRKLLQGGNLVQLALVENGTAVSLDYFPEPVFRPGIVSTAEWGNIVLGPGEAGQDIADFAGDPRKHYRITCSAIRFVPELDQMHPRLIIALDPLEEKGDMVLNLFLVLATAALLLLALIAAVIHIVVQKRSLTNR